MTGVIIKRINLNTVTDSLREKKMRRHTGKRKSCDWSDGTYKPRDTKGCWQTPDARRGKEEFFPQTIRENTALPTPRFLTSGLQSHETINLLF